MGFDKQQVLEEINATLESVPLPGSSGNLISAGYVSRIIAQAGNVHLVLSFPADVGAAKEEIKETIRTRVAEIAGVESVEVLERVAPPQGPSGSTPQGPGPGGPPGGAPGGAGQPGQVLGAQSIPGVKRIIAVASGKGGVGKSTIAVNLAVELARVGARTGLMDSDVYGPSIPKMLGLEGSRPGVTDGERLVPLEKHGVKTMSIGFMLDDESPVIWRGPMVTGLLRQFLFQVDWGELDYLILDLPPGTGDAQLTLTQSVALDGGIIVTTPQDVALLDVQRGIQMFKRVEVPILGVLENMSLYICPHCGETSDPFSSGGGETAAQRYDVPFLGKVPLDSRYASAGDSGEPITASDPQAELSKIIQQMVAKIRQTFE